MHAMVVVVTQDFPMPEAGAALDLELHVTPLTLPASSSFRAPWLAQVVRNADHRALPELPRGSSQRLPAAQPQSAAVQRSAPFAPARQV